MEVSSDKPKADYHKIAQLFHKLHFNFSFIYF